ncbi:PIG-X [Lipomyces japonicus]|uniref:PIG-X n=1 Tax=Lipomyces japonicus TaxID=56871 RepID=UPI0034CF56ED
MPPSIRQRHTFLVHQKFRDTPDSLRISRENVKLLEVPATRHDRISLDFRHLYEQDKDILGQIVNIRIEIVSADNYGHVSPFDRKVAWGSHIYVVPTKTTNWNKLCQWIHSVINPEIPCVGEETFITLPYAHYLYSTNTSTATLIARAANAYSEQPELQNLAFPSTTPEYLSLSLDKKTSDPKLRDVLVAEFYWSVGNWTSTFVPSERAHDHQVEVGLLGKLNDDENGELTFGGIIAVVGENGQWVPTLFDFSPRHRSLAHPAVIDSHFRLPYGLHPKHVTTIKGDLTPPRSDPIVFADEEIAGEFANGHVEYEKVDCKLYAYYTLPNFIFVDKYQISDLADAKAGGVNRVVGIWGETDLEIPVWIVDKWGSSMLLELVDPLPPASSGLPQTLELEIPMHSRYEVPGWNQSVVKHDMPWPNVFWACSGAIESELSLNPFDSKALGHERFFSEGTTFHYLTPNLSISRPGTGQQPNLKTTLDIPVVPLETYKYVQPWTVAVIVLGCLWIFYKTFLNFKKDGGIRRNPGVKPSKEKLEKKGPKTE